MKPIERNLEKIEAQFTPGTAKTNEDGVKTTRALLGPGTLVRGLLGPGAHEMEATGDGPSPLEQSGAGGEGRSTGW